MKSSKLLTSALLGTITSLSLLLAPEKSTAQSVNNLDGTWNYQVSTSASQCSVKGACSIKIVGGVGQYVKPTGGSGVFLFNVYPTTINRGKPVLTMTAIGLTGQEVSYAIVHSGRLVQPGLVSGRYVDVINQQGSFTLTKQP